MSAGAVLGTKKLGGLEVFEQVFGGCVLSDAADMAEFLYDTRRVMGAVQTEEKLLEFLSGQFCVHKVPTMPREVQGNADRQPFRLPA